MSDLTVGSTLAGYRIESLIGRGSSGAVYLAHEELLDRRVAVKTLLPELAADERFRERFLRESRIAAQLEHPGILPIYAAGEEDGVVYLAMRFVDGADLGRLIQAEGALAPERAVQLLVQIADALDAAHRRGLVHRDVKPGNILVDDVDRAYLTDFGLAKHSASVNSLSRDTPFAGTIDYIAPEQARGEEMDARTDVYSLGCVLYETVTGTPPFRRANDLASVLAHLNDPPPSLDSPLDPVIARALAKQPEDRYASAGAFMADARAALGDGEAAGSKPARVAQLRTFLITDVRGYTRYTREHGDEAAAALAAQFAELVGEVVSRRDGRLLELRGDEALVVFESARRALQAAVDLQARAKELPRGIGIGLDAGEAVPVGRGFRGAALNTAARLCARAQPGEILASAGVVHLAGSVDGVAYGIRRPERLKGFEKPVTAVEIHGVGSERGHARARSVRARARATRGRVRLAAALVVGLVAAAAAAAVVLSGGSGPALAANSLGVLDAKTGKAKAVTPASDIDAFVGDAHQLWALTTGGTVLQQVDVHSHRLGRQFALPVSPDSIAPTLLDGSIWATDPHKPALLRIDPRYGSVADTINLPDPTGQTQGGAPQNAQGVAIADGSVWVTYGFPKRIARYTPSAGTAGKLTTRALPGGLIFNASVAAEGKIVWVVDRDGHKLIRIDPHDLSVAATGRLHGGSVEDARVAGGSLWVALQNDGGVWQVQQDGTIAGKVATGDVPYSLATGDGAVWVANANSGTVTKIDPVTDAATTFPVGHRPVTIGVTGPDVWVFAALGVQDVRARISGSNVVREAAIGNPYNILDPDTCCSEPSFVLQYATGARLMDYRPTADGGAKIVPSVAAGAPEIADHGRTWTFRISPGFRFSPPSGQVVTAETFRYTIERAVSPKLTNTYCRYALLSDIAGEDSYAAGKAAHISGLTASGDTLRIRLKAPSWTLPARLAMPCFTAVPIGTPVAPDGIQQPVPSAGPYYVDYDLPDFQLVMKKNPNYGGHLRRRVDGMIVTESMSAAQAGAAVEQGQADWAVDDTGDPTDPFAPGGRYQRRYGSAGTQRYFRAPVNGTRFLLLNTVAGPLKDVRLRRAVALALNRRRLAPLSDGEPRSLFLPPGLPGYGARDVFGSGPDLARARALVGGRRVRLVLATNGASQAEPPLAQEIGKELAPAGITVGVQAVGDPWGMAAKGHPRVDMLLDGWIADYPDPEDFFAPILDSRDNGNSYPPFFTDQGWLARIAAAARTPGAARATAYQRLDVALARGPLPVTGIAANFGSPQLFSARVGCHTFLPYFAGLADPTSLCLR